MATVCTGLHGIRARGGQATRVRLNDAGTRVRWQGPPRWDDLASEVVHTQAQVDVQLDTSALTGRSARVYMRLSDGPPGIDVAWTAVYWLRPGRLQLGQESLVWQGVPPPGLLHDVLHLTVRAPGALAQSSALSFAFEAEAAA